MDKTDSIFCGWSVANGTSPVSNWVSWDIFKKALLDQLIGQFLLVGTWLSHLLNSLSIIWVRDDIAQLFVDFVGQKSRIYPRIYPGISGRELCEKDVDFDSTNSSNHGFLFVLFPNKADLSEIAWFQGSSKRKETMDNYLENPYKIWWFPGSKTSQMLPFLQHIYHYLPTFTQQK